MLRVDDVRKSYGKQMLFKHLSFDVGIGEIACISGPNGSGKSTLTKAICGQIATEEGIVLLNGKIVSAPNFSICSPHTALYEAFTVNELYQFTRQLLPLNLSQKDLPDYLMLSKKICAQRRLEKFSSGMKQRVKLTFALQHPGAILILDEPSSNLDTQAHQWYIDRWKAVKEKKINIIASNNVAQECPFEHKAITLATNA